MSEIWEENFILEARLYFWPSAEIRNNSPFRLTGDMVGRHIGSDLVLTLLNGAGKPKDTDNGMESKGAIQGGKRGEGNLIPMASELADFRGDRKSVV